MIAVVRRALPDDAAALSDFAERIFRETFADTNSPEDMELYCAGAFGPEIQAREIADPSVVTFVVHSGSTIVGYAQLCDGASPVLVAGSSPIELKRFYIATNLHGTPLAQTLMAHVIEFALTAHHDVIWLGVWEQNPRAIRFYEKSGFRVVGDHVFLMGRDAQRDVIMVRPVSTAI
jgi:diamine N-acetyltransferase